MSVLLCGLLYASIASLIVFAFASASKRSDDTSDEALDLIDGDIRPADLLRSPFHKSSK